MVCLAIGRLLPAPKVSIRNLTGKHIIVTGSNSGVGFSIAKQLAAMGATVHMACRNVAKAEVAAREIREHLAGTTRKKVEADVRVLELDTASLASVRRFVQSWPTGNKIYALYHNAGMPGADVAFTADEQELTYQSNFLSSFLMTRLLEAKDAFAADARIIFTSSSGHYGGRFSSDFGLRSRSSTADRGFHYPPAAPVAIPSTLYSNSKLSQVACARILQSRFNASGSRMSAAAFSPGYAASAIFGKVETPSLSRDPLFWILTVATVVAVMADVGAASGVMLATRDLSEQDKGKYWERCGRRFSKADLLEQETLDRLWIRWCNDAGLSPVE